MIDQNLRVLRKKFRMTQEQLAEKMNVSRQTVAKWETGVSTPDITACVRLAKIFQIQLEDLILDRPEAVLLTMAPRGKYLFGTVTINEDNTIRLPKEACVVFNIRPGDSIVVLGDQNQGIALMPAEWCRDFFNAWQNTEEKKS